jgi:hypothetical protein
MSIAGVDAEGWILGLSGALEPGDRGAFQQAAEAARAEQRCLCIMRPCRPRAYSGVGSPTSGGGGPRKFAVPLPSVGGSHRCSSRSTRVGHADDRGAAFVSLNLPAFLSPSLAAMLTHAPHRLAPMQGGDS